MTPGDPNGAAEAAGLADAGRGWTECGGEVGGAEVCLTALVEKVALRKGGVAALPPALRNFQQKEVNMPTRRTRAYMGSSIARPARTVVV